MMKKKALFLLPAAAVLSAACVAASVNVATSADTADGWSDCQVENTYLYKDEFTVTERTYTIGGKSYTASALVYYPDGAVSTNDKITLNQAGRYAVKYSVQTEKGVYTDTQNFLVQYPAYDVASEKSSVRYGTPDRATTPGVMARIAQNDALTFTRYIDFTSVTAEDVLVEGYVTPDVVKAMDFSELVFTFTDSEDSSVFFQVHHYGYDWTYNTYVAANGHNQVPTGLDQGKNNLVQEDNGYGTWSYVPFNSVGLADGQQTVVAPDATKFYVTMDYAKKEVYVLGYPGTKTLCIDLDSESIKGEWTGFPSGKARLSVSAYNYSGTTANLCITKVHGIDDLSNNVCEDSVAPVVQVDEAFATEMPLGLKGAAYTIPSATAYDAYAYGCDVDVSVWFNYGMENSVKVPVQNGQFIPETVGTYGILYEARDKVGNVGSVLKWVTVFESVSAAEFELPADKITQAKAGEWISVPAVDADTITGGSGKKTMTTFIEIDGTREEVFGGFRASKVGTYKVIYVATDYVGSQTEKYYELTVTAGDTPVLEENFDVFPAYISEQKYILPLYYAYSYANGKLNKTLCDVVVTDANGAKTYKAGGEATITVKENGETVTFAVVSGGATLATHQSVGVMAWLQESAGRRFHVENYLVGEGFSTEKTSEGMVLTATDKNGFGYTFANAVSARYASLKLTQISGMTNSAKITVTLTDSLKADSSVSVTLYSDGGNVGVDCGAKRTLTSLVSGGVEVVYQNGAFVINGEKFAAQNDFASGKVFVSVSYTGYGEDAGFTFAEFGNCRFSTQQTDRIAPLLFSEVETGGTFRLGDHYTIVAPVAYDVYSPNIEFTLTVTDAHGNPAQDVNGALLQDVDPTKNYEIVLDKIGSYLVLYTAKESTDFVSKVNPATLRYSLTVADEEAPTIHWTGSFQTDLKVNDVFVLPTYTVSDNYTESENIVVAVFVETPQSQLIMLPGNAIQMTHEGVYQVRVMVVDGSGNIHSETHYVTVTKAEGR